MSTSTYSRELRKSLAVKLTFLGWAYRAVASLLNVSISFVSKWKNGKNFTCVKITDYCYIISLAFSTTKFINTNLYLPYDLAFVFSVLTPKFP
jgi:transcriptional regulator with XRE-family HTH domain